jgi:hypothetical protein
MEPTTDWEEPVRAPAPLAMWVLAAAVMRATSEKLPVQVLEMGICSCQRSHAVHKAVYIGLGVAHFDGTGDADLAGFVFSRAASTPLT